MFLWGFFPNYIDYLQTVLRDDAIKTLQQARDEYHDKLIEQEEMLESLNEVVENLRADNQERTDKVTELLQTYTMLELTLKVKKQSVVTLSLLNS
jgi:iron-sulfur cluster repair protein YtfE (RIC family)